MFHIFDIMSIVAIRFNTAVEKTGWAECHHCRNKCCPIFEIKFTELTKTYLCVECYPKIKQKSELCWINNDIVGCDTYEVTGRLIVKQVAMTLNPRKTYYVRAITTKKHYMMSAVMIIACYAILCLVFGIILVI